MQPGQDRPDVTFSRHEDTNMAPTNDRQILQSRLDVLDFTLREARDLLADLPIGDARSDVSIDVFVNVITKLDQVRAKLPDLLKT